MALIRYLCRERRKFLSGAVRKKYCRPVHVTGNANVSIIESDCRYTFRDIAKAVGISQVHFILKRILKVRKIFFCQMDTLKIDKLPKQVHMYEYKLLNICLQCLPNSIKYNLQILLLVMKHWFIVLN